jgi:hypothetical protein
MFSLIFKTLVEMEAIEQYNVLSFRPKIKIRLKEWQVSNKKEGITRIRRNTLTIHQERRYLSALNISKNDCKRIIEIDLYNLCN